MDSIPKCESKMIKASKENMGEKNLFDLVRQRVFRYDTKNMIHERKIQ